MNLQRVLMDILSLVFLHLETKLKADRLGIRILVIHFRLMDNLQAV